MLAELAAANAAFAIIKQCVENGSELAKAGKAISDFTLNKDAVQKKAAAKGSNLDGSKSDLEEFLALDELKRKEDQLRSMMQLYGRANMYPDYVKFCTEARRQRAEAAAEAKRLAMKRQDNILLIIYWAACLGLGVFAFGLFVYILMEASNV
jgi:hypothetical protein